MRTRASRPTTTPSAKPRSWATTTSSSATAGSAGRSHWSTQGARITSGTGGTAETNPVRRPDAPAEGPARRHRLPLDAGARPDPLCRRPREDERLRHPGRLRREGQERMGRRAARMGEVRRARVHVAQRGPRRERQAPPRPDPARRSHSTRSPKSSPTTSGTGPSAGPTR